MKNLNADYVSLGFTDGPSYTGSPQIEPARMAAEAMEKLIHDQLEESKAITIMRHVFFEMALLGTLSQRFGAKIDYDTINMEITNRPDINKFLKEPVREGWRYGESIN